MNMGSESNKIAVCVSEVGVCTLGGAIVASARGVNDGWDSGNGGHVVPIRKVSFAQLKKNMERTTLI
jgi:hypothetical protein